VAKPRHMMQAYQAPTLLLVAGSGKGKAYELPDGRISIGRAEECDISLPHESVSRTHAYVEKSEDGTYAIFDNQSRNGVFLNGEQVEVAPLREGDVVQLGSFALQFFSGQLVPEGQPEENAYGEYPAFPPVAEKRGINKRLLIYGGAALIIAYALMSGNSTEKKPAEEATEAAAKAPAGFKVSEAPEFQSSDQASEVPGLGDPVLTRIEKDLSKIDVMDTSLREAEQYFRRGQREFSNKNYQRAIDAFSAALSINKRHPLAKYYLDAAIHQSETEAEKHRTTGVKYFESLQFNRAIYHFTQAIGYMAHRPSDPKIAQCEQGIELAKRKLQTVELFP
jgi:tetratricopeptide (TPR) repeat protein